MLSRRERLIDKILHLPDDDVNRVEAFLNSLQTAQPTAATKTSGLSNPIALATVSKDWPHAPTHRISEKGTYIVTGSTMNKQHFFRSKDRLSYLERKLLATTQEFGWQVEAWAVFSNHYHFIANALSNFQPIDEMLKQLHGATSREMNQWDNTSERAVWFNYWETQLTFERSYYARLNYVHQNAVKHGLVRVANQYKWCSAAWFERTATPSQVKTIYSFKTDTVNIRDDFEVVI